MLQLARSVEYALRAIFFLADQPEGKISLVNEISLRQGLPRDYLSKLMQRLVKAELIESSRGPKGGFRLARSANRITLLEVVEAVSGPLNMWTCNLKTSCPMTQNCPFHAVWKEANDKIAEVLGGKTVGEMMINSQ